MDYSAIPYRHPVPWDHAIEPRVLPDLLLDSAARDPKAPACDFMGRTTSYARIADEARRFAAGLTERGIGKGDRVGLFLPNVPTYIAAYYGAMMAGAVVVNFSPLYSTAELADQVADSGTRLLVTVDVAQLLDTALEVLDRSALETLVVARLGRMLPLRKRMLLKLFGRRRVRAIPRRADVLSWVRATDVDPAQPVALKPDDLALLQYTGGTTGPPKGAMLTHANLSVNAGQVNAIDPFETRDVIMGALPLFHVFANTCTLNRTVLKGGCMVMVARFDAGEVLAAIDRTRPTAFPGVPTMYQALLDHARAARTDFSSLQVCVSGGAAMAGPVRERFEALSGARLVEGYGLTESSGVVSVNPYRGERKPGTIGQPIPGTRVMLLDKEDATRAAPDGEPGELAVAGPQLMQGYWNRPEAAADAFVEQDGTRWLRTGDVATLDADGFIAIVDRMKDMISVGGFKVFPSRIEEVLQERAEIAEVLVLGLADDYLGEAPHAYVVLDAEAEQADGDELMAWLNECVGKHERVQSVTIRDDLPKTMIGKLDRKALREEVGGV